MNINNIGKNITDFFTSVVEGLDSNQRFFLSLVICLIVIISFTITPFFNHLKNSEDRDERKYMEELKMQKRVQSKLDSIEKEKDIISSQLFIYKNNEINNLMSYLERRLPESSHITIFSVHNGGGTPVTGGEAKISVLYTTDNVRGVNILRDYSNTQLYPGYAKYCQVMLNNNGSLFYIPDVTKDKNIYINETKDNMNYLNTKSIGGVFIKAGPTSTYYISVSWNTIDGANINGINNLERTLDYAIKRLSNLLDAK